MKQIAKIAFIATIVTSFATSCKTSEKNYRQAYDVAKEARQTDDSNLMADIEKERAPITMIIGNDTIKYRKELVTVSIDGGGESKMLKRYNIVVGRFRQIFNAKSMQARMSDLGYTSFVIENREPAYFVVVYSTDSKEDAAKKFKEIESNRQVIFKSPFPWVLEPARYVPRNE